METMTGAVFETVIDIKDGSDQQVKPGSSSSMSSQPSPAMASTSASSATMTTVASPTFQQPHHHAPSTGRPSMRRGQGSARSSRSSQSGSSRGGGGGEDTMMQSVSTDSVGGDTNDTENAQLAGQAADRRIDELKQNSRLRIERDIVALRWEDVAVEDMLGVGGFACVCLTRIRKLNRHLNKQHRKSLRRLNHATAGNGGGNPSTECSTTAYDEESSSLALDHGEHLAAGNIAPKAEKRYALKCLNRRTMANRRQFVSGAADLAGEGFLLSRLCHENIIRVYGATAGGMTDAFLEPGGYFLVLEALEGTLHDLLNKWRELDPPRTNTSVRSLFKANSLPVDGGSDGSITIPSVQDRLQKIAVGIARGVCYLHENRVLFRDIKPHNVGLDREGNVRLFDFGLAREVDTIKRNIMTNEPLGPSPENDARDKVPNGITPKSNELLLVKGVAGSLRYMAPETMLQSFCSPASDAYGFGIVLWELCTLIKPFDKVTATPRDFRKAVAVNGLRPNVRVLGTGNNGHVHMKVIRALMESCWATDWQARPDFGIIVEVLEKLVGIESSSASDNNKLNSVTKLDDKLTGEMQRQQQNEAPAPKSMFGLGSMRRNKRSSPNLVLKSHLSNESLSNWSLSMGSTANAWKMSSSKRRSRNSLVNFGRGKRKGSTNSLSSPGDEPSNGQANATWNATSPVAKEGRGIGIAFSPRRKSTDKLVNASPGMKKSGASSSNSLSGNVRTGIPDDRSGAGQGNAMWNSAPPAKTWTGMGSSQKRRSSNALASFTRSLKRSGASSSNSLSDNARTPISDNHASQRQPNTRWKSVGTANAGNDDKLPSPTMVSMTGLHRLERRNMVSSPALTSTSYATGSGVPGQLPLSTSQQAGNAAWSNNSPSAASRRADRNASWNAAGGGSRSGGSNGMGRRKSSGNRLASILGMQPKRSAAPLIDLKG